MTTALSEASRWEHILRPGNTNCAGCGMSLGLRWLEEGLGENKPYMVIPACCGIVTAGAYPTSAYGAPTAASTFASSAAVASGITSVLAMNGEKSPVACWAGDGGTYDIGMATVSAAAERNEDIIYVCYDNEIYGNTGGQRSGATPEGVVTSTTTEGKRERKKDMMSIIAAHRVPYAATLSVAHRRDFLRKIHVAKSIKGFRFLLMLSPCPTGWKSEPEESVELIRAAVQCGLFPLYEVFDGLRYRVNVKPSDGSIEDYVTKQRRYVAGHVDPAMIRARIDEQWSLLNTLASAFPARTEEGQIEYGREFDAMPDACRTSSMESCACALATSRGSRE